MSIIITLVIGLIAGFVARAIKPGDDNMGIIMTTALGVAGSFVASYGGAALGLFQAGGLWGFVGSVIGAIILLFVLTMGSAGQMIRTLRDQLQEVAQRRLSRMEELDAQDTEVSRRAMVAQEAKAATSS